MNGKQLLKLSQQQLAEMFITVHADKKAIYEAKVALLGPVLKIYMFFVLFCFVLFVLW